MYISTYHRNINSFMVSIWASQVALVVKNLPANTGDIRDAGSIPGLGRSPGEGSDNSLQYSCLENPMDRGAWQATVHRVTKSWTQLKQLSTHTLILPPILITATLKILTLGSARFAETCTALENSAFTETLAGIVSD